MKSVCHPWNKTPFGGFLLMLICLTASTHIQAQTHAMGTNSFYDNDTVFDLKTDQMMRVEGEVSNPGEVSFQDLPMHTVVVKEVLYDQDGNRFVGAYRYEGYALSDLLDPFVVRKDNQELFPPMVDLYIEIFNRAGEKVVISWGELYYPNQQAQIIIATKVMRIVPEKTLERWPLPTTCKLVVAHDMVTARNLSDPERIVVRSVKKEMMIEKGKFPMSSQKVILWQEDLPVDTLDALPGSCDQVTLHTVFYGKGRGLHSLEPFTGCPMKAILAPLASVSEENLMHGLVLFGAEDGYRAVFTLSELVNRNDQQNSILIKMDDKKGAGRFRLFPSCDFFSDRSVKGLTHIWFSSNTF